ncbi:MAG: hypothetical protein BMS9Abin25_0614 [Gammaproteobacteria bacterium]|nr:MAG: hypothetical protein BMS9Abin25_0614 [Gammaproteobacteria bacterium]
MTYGDTDMTDKKENKSDKESNDEKLEKRRQALKNILAGSGTVVTAAALQDKWAKPVIESVVLPAHAQASGVNGSFTTTTNPRNENDLLEMLVPRANAAPVPCTFLLCINISGGFATVQVNDNGTISTGSGALPFNITLSPSGNTITGTYDAANDRITGTYAGTCLNGAYPPATRSTATCNLTVPTTSFSPPPTSFPIR